MKPDEGESMIEIERYVAGGMSPEEMLAFERKLERSPELRRALEAELAIGRAVAHDRAGVARRTAGDREALMARAARLPEQGLPDSRLPDSRPPDSRLPDSRLPDSRLPDSRLPEPSQRTLGRRILPLLALLLVSGGLGYWAAPRHSVPDAGMRQVSTTDARPSPTSPAPAARPTPDGAGAMATGPAIGAMPGIDSGRAGKRDRGALPARGTSVRSDSQTAPRQSSRVLDTLGSVPRQEAQPRTTSDSARMPLNMHPPRINNPKESQQ